VTVVSYFMGNNPDKWQTNLPTFTFINLGELYPGITVKLRASGSNVEKLFFVDPGANVDDIKIKIRGADHLTIDSAGQLVIASSGFEDVSISKPNAFQDSNNDVASAYNVTGDSYGFIVGAYDHTKPLTIDPSLPYSTYLGGSGIEEGLAIAVDNSGNAYITRYTQSANFPTTSGAFQKNHAGGGQDAFVSKLNPQGSALVYSTYLGGSSYETGYGIAVDGSGNAYITGVTGSTNFPITSGAFQTTYGGSVDAFVSKLNP
jgi:Beta-propeller repeat